MSLIKSGKCKNCNKEFYWSIGQPSWSMSSGMFYRFPQNEEEKKNQQQWNDWWYKSGNLCPTCHPKMPEGDSGINIMMVR